jgi:hypothetical protein
MIDFVPLWSLRWSHSFGWYWKLERDCEIFAQDAWLAAFRKAEPRVTFTCARKTPKVPKGLKAPRVCTCDRLTAPADWDPSDPIGHYPDCPSLLTD